MNLEEALLLAVLNEDEEQEMRHKKRQKKRRVWVHEINQLRKAEGEFHALYEQLRSDEKRFHVYFRMDIESFDELLLLIEDDIKKDYSKFREPIEPVERLAVTLRFLATGDSYKTIGHSYRMGFSTISKIVKEVCVAIWKRLHPIYMPDPTTEIWEKSMSGFNNIWQFPNCLGSIDGKHVTIKCPPKSGSMYYCYLNKFSIVLLAIVDPHYQFIGIDVGGYGKNSDGGIFEASNMGKRFEDGTFKIPKDKCFPGKYEPLPCVLIGDEAFTLSQYLMRPFPYRQTRNDIRKEKFNYQLCRARRVVENAFGILVHKWRVFLRPLEVKVETAVSIVQAACVLHNFLGSKNHNQTVENLVETAETPLVEGLLTNLPIEGRRATNYAFQLREKFVDYFNNMY